MRFSHRERGHPELLKAQPGNLPRACRLRQHAEGQVVELAPVLGVDVREIQNSLYLSRACLGKRSALSLKLCKETERERRFPSHLSVNVREQRREERQLVVVHELGIAAVRKRATLFSAWRPAGVWRKQTSLS